MSKDIFETDNLQVTAFGGKEGTAWVQISCKSDFSFAQLDEAQPLALAHALISRILRKEGYCATD